MSEQTTDQLLTNLEQEVHHLLHQIVKLRKENLALKKQLSEKPTNNGSDLFGELSLTEKMTLKAKVNQMIQKVDLHLENLNE